MWNPFKLKKKPTGTKLIGEYSGHKFYIMEDLGQECNARFMRYYQRCQEADTLGIPLLYIAAQADQLKEIYTNMIAEDSKPPEHQKAKRFLPAVEQNLRLLIDQEKLKWHHYTLGIIENFILVDDEQPLIPSRTHNQTKHDLFNRNPEIRFFFIAFAQTWLNQLGQLSNDIKLEDYFKGLGNLRLGSLASIMSHLTEETFGNYEKLPDSK